ncbi:MAG: hemerythrin domain-containing protein [Clostridia bacterium]|jgi:hemerythrin-like domain-containing protein
MNCIELMVEEHRNIKRMLVVIRKYCYRILQDERIEFEDFYKIIDFLRNYTDEHHHGKEESMLFNRMLNELGPIAEKLITHGMLVEHNLARLHIQELEDALKRVREGDDEARLDVIANAISYTHLLKRHIQKEDDAMYTYASQRLNKETLDALNQECKEYEEDSTRRALRGEYLSLLRELERKVE